MDSNTSMMLHVLPHAEMNMIRAIPVSVLLKVTSDDPANKDYCSASDIECEGILVATYVCFLLS